MNQKDIDPSTPGGQYDGKTFTFRIIGSEAQAATVTLIPRASAPGITPVVAGATKVYVSVPAGIPSLNPGHVHLTGALPVHALGASPSVLDIPLRTVAADLDRDTPAVVSIQRLRPGSQTVVAAFQEAAVTGPFTVRIVLSETPADAGTFNTKINVANATKSGFVIGTPFVRHGGSDGTDRFLVRLMISQSQGRRSGRIRLRVVTTMTVLDTPALGEEIADAEHLWSLGGCARWSG